MTISNDNTRNDYTGNGSTVSFPYTFKIFNATDLRVLLKDTLGVESELTYLVNYTISGIGSATGGNVVFNTAPATGVTVSILAKTSFVQNTDIRNQSAFYPDTIEDEFDRQTRMSQILNTEKNRSVRLKDTTPGVAPTLPTPVSGQALGWDASGNLVNIATSPYNIQTSNIVDVGPLGRSILQSYDKPGAHIAMCLEEGYQQNLLINPTFCINQRGFVSGSTPTLNQYTFDRWKCTATGGSIEGPYTGDLSYWIRINGSTTRLSQIVEGNLLDTGVYTLYHNGTAQAYVNGVPVTATAYAGANIYVVRGTNITISFGPGTVIIPRLIRGADAYASNAVVNPALELLRCQRYYETGSAKLHAKPATTISMACGFKVQKRASPTMAYYSDIHRLYLPDSTEWVDVDSFGAYRLSYELSFKWAASAEL